VGRPACQTETRRISLIGNRRSQPPPPKVGLRESQLSCVLVPCARKRAPLPQTCAANLRQRFGRSRGIRASYLCHGAPARQSSAFRSPLRDRTEAAGRLGRRLAASLCDEVAGGRRSTRRASAITTSRAVPAFAGARWRPTWQAECAIPEVLPAVTPLKRDLRRPAVRNDRGGSENAGLRSLISRPGRP
jgi:hypothetical protein